MPHASIRWGIQRRPVRIGYGLSRIDGRDPIDMSLPPVMMDDLVRTSVDFWGGLGPIVGLRGACSLARFNNSGTRPKASLPPLLASCKTSSPYENVRSLMSGSTKNFQTAYSIALTQRFHNVFRALKPCIVSKCISELRAYILRKS